MRRGFVAFAVIAFLWSAPAVAASRFLTGFEIDSNEPNRRFSISLACQSQVVGEETNVSGDRLQLRLDVTSLCRGSAPSVARSYVRLRPKGSDDIFLASVEYDGSSLGESLLTLNFDRPVNAVVTGAALADQIVILLEPIDETPVIEKPATEDRMSRLVRRPADKSSYAVNLSSSRRHHAMSDVRRTDAVLDKQVYETQVDLPNGTWYRLQVGYFDSYDEAEAAAQELAEFYPSAWVDRVDTKEAATQPQATFRDEALESLPEPALSSVGLDKVDEIMSDARNAYRESEYSRAVQLYTKVLRVPNHDRHAEAQEMLGLSRERNGQTAHARAEYEKYLSLYPDSEFATRVQQRLASLLAVDRRTMASAATGQMPKRKRRADSWSYQTFLSQYYRRDVNQPGDGPDLVSQAAIYSDINFDARKRGDRFDLGSRVSVGYRHDMLNSGGTGNDWRVNYAYFDMDDSQLGLRGRIGRQTRHSGGVLGRFDGANVGYDLGDWLTLGVVAGTPVYSTADGADTDRFFYGLSVNYSPDIDGLEVGAYLLEQRISGLVDRQVVGGELRWFADRHSIWGMLDYDTEFGEMSSSFLQASWRMTDNTTLHGSIDRRHTPFLALGSSMTGQPVFDFDEMLVVFTEPELRQLSLDRTPISTSFTLGVSKAISPRVQLGADFNQTNTDPAPESGGVAAVPSSTYRFLSSHLTTNSLLFEGDTMIFGLRASESDSANIYSTFVDARFPIATRWRINPRLRVDYRDFVADNSTEWQFIPGIRVQFRHGQRFRFDFEVSKTIADREFTTTNLERGSYFFSAGYQLFFR